MQTPEAEVPFGKLVLVSQFIIASLLAGPLVFLAIAVLVGPVIARQGARAPGQPDDTFALIMTCTALAFGAMALVMSFVLPPIISANGRKAALKRSLAQNTAGGTGKGGKLQTIDEAQASLLPQFQAQLIVGAAILEGATFFAGVVSLLLGGMIAPAIAILLMIVLAARFPTTTRAQLWLDQQREKLRDEEFTVAASR
jgi:hypothetical protein